MYHLGKYLQHRYKYFLGNSLDLNFLEAYATSAGRTKTSLQLVLAAMFPPSEEQRVDKDLHWQPIPYSNSPRTQDPLFMAILSCPNYHIEMKKALQLSKFTPKDNSDGKLFEFINKKTGTTYMNYIQMLALYDGLYCQEQWGLHLPEWTKHIYPDKLKALALKGYETSFATLEQKKMLGGYLLQKIIKDSLEHSKSHKKLFLYSGHDFTVLGLLNVLKLFNTSDPLPTFGETLILELHNHHGSYGFKVI